MALGAVTRRALVLAWILASFAVVGEASAQETPHASIQWEGVEGDWLDTQAICDRVLSRTGVTLDVEPETRALPRPSPPPSGTLSPSAPGVPPVPSNMMGSS